MSKTIRARCQACGVLGTHRVCEKCGNMWHCNKKSGRTSAQGMNVCEACGKHQ